MRNKRELRHQSRFTVRIPNDVDPGFLEWLNRQYQVYGFQRIALEALYRLYEDLKGADCRWSRTLLVTSSNTTGENTVPTEQLVEPIQVQSSNVESERETSTDQDPEQEEYWGNVFDMFDYP
jgi:hypothetical protein